MAPQTAMSIKDGLLADFEHEMATARKHLEQIPDDKLSWTPHEKSMTLGRLGSHLAECAAWTGAMTDQDEFDIAPPDGSFDSPRSPHRLPVRPRPLARLEHAI